MEGMFTHEYFMKMALKEATYAYEEDEVPVGIRGFFQSHFHKIFVRKHSFHNQT